MNVFIGEIEMNSKNKLNASFHSHISSRLGSEKPAGRTREGNNPARTIGLPSQPTFAGRRPSRVAAVLLLIAAVAIILFGGGPHVLYRAPLALIAAWGFWQSKTWAFTLSVINAAIWLMVFFMIMPFLLVASPKELWLTWLYWLVTTGFALIPCIIMLTSTGRTEREAWKERDDVKTDHPK